MLPALTCPPSSTSDDYVAVADRVDSNAFMQVDLPDSDQGPRQTCLTCAVLIDRAWRHYARLVSLKPSIHLPQMGPFLFNLK